MVSCVSQVPWPCGPLCVLCLHGWACAHEVRLEADGGRVNGMRWVLEEEEGCRGGVLFIGSELQKKLLMALLHDWAFVTAIVLPATSARDTALSASQLIINHLRLITKEAASSPSD